MTNKRGKSTYNNVHYNPELKELTMGMWMEGKSEEEINTAIREFLWSRRRRGRSRDRVNRSS